MHIVTAIFGATLLAIAFADAFQTVVVARHARRLPMIARTFYRVTWPPFAAGARFVSPAWRRDKYLGVYGPLSLLVLIGCWVVSLIVAFAMVQWAFGAKSDGIARGFASDIYLSAATFFTLGTAGLGNPVSESLMVIEAGFGYSFLGLVISYLPVLYQSFSARELHILMLDARAGSPPSAAQVVLRRGDNPAKLEKQLADWEEWALDLLQGHLSYPMLAFYRSQHANESWLAALTMVVDVSALAMLGAEGDLKRQAEFTFAAGRHALGHTASIFNASSPATTEDRLLPADFSRLCAAISAAPTPLHAERIMASELARFRTMYEPHAKALAAYFRMDLPPWFVQEPLPTANWQAVSWQS
ncbi:two pore domain potassium channel family protein [Burkholderia ubonensis]|uniref:two pore domain potassium channel family protein n=1 Tax=Burkholderia ubonensis TaxID=101571 RepID=UPI000F56432D|nr:two pore domain potassium channel family protein [Burkholderia ubonensis]RQP27723.1 two pore domain potassium channel family protein [Burkholderia ubonensis]RQP29739.1 two pore domain potassium channel family protein [Burkholderia ubonensis]RQP31895.1 two pore domain potassium channel family protein [Burkholderia ubonensis]RQP47838.1 two pore domain potassium channel family protein [Burkholderia ubonensis]RQP50855.1 two pore domain potassium channel family protein [Burkholderia ubonensis]